MASNDNYPAGALEDPRAPFNEELNVEYTGEVSIILDGPVRVYLPRNATDRQIREAVYAKAEEKAKKAGLIITDITIVDYESEE